MNTTMVAAACSLESFNCTFTFTNRWSGNWSTQAASWNRNSVLVQLKSSINKRQMYLENTLMSSILDEDSEDILVHPRR